MTVTQDSGWGGRRLGVEGRAYGQRTDLNANPQRTTPSPPPATVEGMAPGLVTPDQTPNLFDPSTDARPVTAGVPVGPGPGTEALAPTPEALPDRTLMTLQALYRATGSDHIRRTIARYDRGRGLA
jgi:hypothetical protein